MRYVRPVCNLILAPPRFVGHERAADSSDLNWKGNKHMEYRQAELEGVDLGRVALRDVAADPGEVRIAAFFDSEVRRKMEATKGLQYHHALKLVASEHQDLTRQYRELSLQHMDGQRGLRT